MTQLKNRPEDDSSIVETCRLIITFSNKLIVQMYTVSYYITLQARRNVSIQISFGATKPPAHPVDGDEVVS